MNYKDIGYKALWTGISAVLGYLLVVATPVTAAWGPVAVVLINTALAFVRQQLGATPPDAPTNGVFKE